MASTNEHVFSDSVTNPRFSDAPSIASPVLTSSRPTSHHRRRSSVSTRRESAEMMGVCYSEPTLLDDPDTDAIRRNALHALEGKAVQHAQVEIPNLGTLFPDKKPDVAAPKKSPFQIVNRDSFGRVHTPSLASKDLLHTLVEEEEEEDDRDQTENLARRWGQPAQRSRSPLPMNESYLQTSDGSMTKAPNTSSRPGLKPLTLAAAPALSVPSGNAANRSGSLVDPVKRRSSLSYKRSLDVSSPTQSITLPQILAINSLPTPELTPVTSERPQSPEQAFFQANQSSLVARIHELERALAMRSRSNSIASSYSPRLSISSSVSSEGPSDEMLCLVRDLKAERDDLNREIAVYKTNLGDLEKQVSLLTRRVENERRDAWQAREKANLLDVERKQVQQKLALSFAEVDELKFQLAASQSSEQKALATLEQERLRCRTLERDLERAVRAPKIRVDSSSSAGTAVESVAQSYTPLKVVVEEGSGEEDELAHYEDEGDDDMDDYSDDSFSAPPRYPGASSPSNYLTVTTASGDTLPSPSSVASTTPPVTPAPITPSMHNHRTSLDKGWSFPQGAQVNTRAAAEVDRFFQCLDDLDQSPEDLSAFGSFKSKKSAAQRFFASFDDDSDDDLPPFVIPADRTGAVHPASVLDSVREEEEESCFNAGMPYPLAPRPAPKRKPAPQADQSLFGSARYTRASDKGGHTLDKDVFKPKPRSPAPEVQSFGSPQTPRKTGASSIPKLSQSPGKPKPASLPITPMSNPRAKPTEQSSNMHSYRRPTQGLPSPSPSSPTRLPISKKNTNSGSVAANGNGGKGLSTLSNYLQWTGWGGMPRGGAGQENTRMPQGRGLTPMNRTGNNNANSRGLVLL